MIEMKCAVCGVYLIGVEVVGCTKDPKWVPAVQLAARVAQAAVFHHLEHKHPVDAMANGLYCDARPFAPDFDTYLRKAGLIR